MGLVLTISNQYRKIFIRKQAFALPPVLKIVGYQGHCNLSID